jgi:hypothetical protein
MVTVRTRSQCLSYNLTRGHPPSNTPSRMRRILPVTLAALAALAAPALPMQAQTSADSAAIRATALDYIDGWYSGDAERMERALHPHLAKRLVSTDSRGQSRLLDLTALELIQSTREGTGKIPRAAWKDSVSCSRLLRTLALRQIRAWSDVDGHGTPLSIDTPPSIDHDAIEQVFLAKSSETFYYAGGRVYRKLTTD